MIYKKISSKLKSFFTQIKVRLGSKREIARRSLIFNEPEYGGNRAYGLGWDSHPHAKIVIFALPKSGNIWLKALLSDYFKMPGINIFLQQKEKGIGITHFPLSPEIETRTDIIQGACLIRDIRDIICSYFHYSQTERYRNARRDFQYNDIEAFYYDWFLPIIVPQYRIHSFSQEYAQMSVPVIRYESLYDNPIEELKKLITRWGFVFDEKQAEIAVANNTLKKLKKAGINFEKHIEKSHFRKGGYGNYKEMPKKIIEDIEERFEDMQKRWGYQ